MLQELVLHEKDGVAVLGQFCRKRTFPAAILPQRKMSIAEVFTRVVVRSPEGSPQMGLSCRARASVAKT